MQYVVIDNSINVVQQLLSGIVREVQLCVRGWFRGFDKMTARCSSLAGTRCNFYRGAS